MKVYSFPVIFIYKGLVFVIICGSFFISSWFYETVTAYWKHLLSFLLIGYIVAFLFFIQLGESMHDLPWFGLFYDIYSTKTEHNQRQTHHLS